MKGKTILAIAAHPDDIEFYCGGSVAYWTSQGASVRYLILTDGSKGSEDHKLAAEELIKLRRNEQMEAAKILGVEKVYFLDFTDGELVNSLEVRKQVVKVIRESKPDWVITFDPTNLYDENLGFVNHPDHRAAGQVAFDSIFPFARNQRTFPDLLEEGLTSHHVQTLLLINLSKKNYFVDIAKTFDAKTKALCAHKSQKDDSEEVLVNMKELAESAGIESGYKLAEGYLKISIKS